MGESLISCLIVSGLSKSENIICTDVRENKLKEIEKEYGIRTTTEELGEVMIKNFAEGNECKTI